jgi:hypothetical protein
MFHETSVNTASDTVVHNTHSIAYYRVVGWQKYTANSRIDQVCFEDSGDRSSVSPNIPGSYWYSGFAAGISLPAPPIFTITSQVVPPPAKAVDPPQR